MASRDQYFKLIGQIAAARAEISALLASQRPEDMAAREILTNQLHDLEQQLLDLEEHDAPVPADGGDAARIGLGENASATLGGVPMPFSVQPYDEAVVSERLLAVGDLYYCYQHERLGIFRVVQKLQELFRAGKLRLASGAGAFELYRFDRKSVLRYNFRQRMQAYRRVFGYTNAPPPAGARSNDSFHGLFSGFCGEVAQLFRDKRVSEVVRANGAGSDLSFGSIAMTRRAGLDLRSNLKGASYGDVNVLTIELLQLLRSAFAILEAEDIRHQFGTDTAWDTMEEVMQRYLGERNVASQRSRMGAAGREIMHWLAQGFILSNGRAQFETLAQQIVEPCEEWLTSAQSVGASHKPANASLSGNVVPFKSNKMSYG